MGQYYRIVNIDKEESITPHNFGDGAKLMEFGASANGTMLALALLTSCGNGRGGGDLHCETEDEFNAVGSWSGDRIITCGDYGDGGKWLSSSMIDAYKEKYPEHFKDGHMESPNLYMYTGKFYNDISYVVMELMSDDAYCKVRMRESLDWRMENLPEGLRKKIFDDEK
jgi:hypothetical protein